MSKKDIGINDKIKLNQLDIFLMHTNEFLKQEAKNAMYQEIKENVLRKVSAKDVMYGTEQHPAYLQSQMQQSYIKWRMSFLAMKTSQSSPMSEISSLLCETGSTDNEDNQPNTVDL
ncbi:hypothetical protein ACOME3_008295 [Neoechinorhynchus agilis]